MLVPYESVHLDLRLPLPAGSGGFLMSSNGLASGNCLLEAISHAVCELVERDANTLWHVGGGRNQALRRVSIASVDDPACCSVLDRFENGGIGVAIWDTTTDVGIASFLVTIVDRDGQPARMMSPVSGSGCHPKRGIALLRALTEAAQGRLTIISGSRDDLSTRSFEAADATADGTRIREIVLKGQAARSFGDGPDAHHDDFEADVEWELSQLLRVGIDQVITVNLSRPQFDLPVVRVVIPGLEGMSEVDGYVLGRRARRAAQEGAQ
jgi:ribosomal protein S12 methylthiotransferase accessory factor